MKLFNAALVWASTTSLFDVISANGGCFDDAPFHPDNWTYCQEISATLHMYYTPLNDTIMLGLHATEGVEGWSSLAPAGNGGMKGASQIVVRKDDVSGEWIAEDRYSMDYVTPSMDEQQDVQLLFAQQDEDTGETAWGVVIPQNSCDEPFDYAIEDRSIFMIWAFGSSHSLSFHGTDRGQFTANLMGPPPTVPALDAYDFVDLLMPNVPMVRGEEDLDPTNPFICSYFDMNVLGQEMGFTGEDKIHMVGNEPVITEGNIKFIHHLVISTCEGYLSFDGEEGEFSGLDDSNLEHNLVVPACTNMPPGCTNLVTAWAVGDDAGAYPEDVGVPIGEGHRWIVMQMHYYNPTLVEDVYDSSGMRIYLTKDLRPVDAGMMLFLAGVATGQHPPLPGGMKDVTMETLYVEPDCTKGWSGPLTVMSVWHHSHYMGTYQEIVVERDGKNLGPMRKEYGYDYYHQTGVEPVNALRTLLPGDRLAATCHFDTSSVSADSEVQIGEESNKEMCFPTLFYYPRQNLTSFSYFPPKAVSQWFINDLEWCSSPPSDEIFDSLCAEKLYADVTNFYNSTFSISLGYEGPSIDYPSVCNGGNETAELREALPICPEGCTETQSCSEEEMRPWAQGVCEFSCGIFGLTVYPDLNRTEVYSTGNVACPNIFFDAPTLAESDACQVKGSLPQTIELLEVTMDKEVEAVSAPVPAPEPEDSSSEPAPEPEDSSSEPAPEPEDSGSEPAPEPEDSSSGANSSWNSFAAFLLIGVFYA